MRKSARILIIIAIIVIIIGAFNYYSSGISAIDISNTENIFLMIPSGSSTDSIGNILLEKGLIRSHEVFKVYLKINNKGSRFKAGDYVMSKSMSIDEICILLENGPNIDSTANITIREGLSIAETVKEINEQFTIDTEKFIELCHDIDYFTNDYEFLNESGIISLEGYLYPETYNIYIDSDEETIIRRLLDGFDAVYKDILKGKMDESLDLNSLMTMASIVEGEAMLDSERPLVASVFYNRLDIGWKLESCATIQYALGERKIRLTFDDLEIQSKYNTYTYKGLPPGPINSPGLESIKASLNPENTDYLFFLAKGDGFHYFTDDYQDFLAAKRKYID